MASHPLFRRRVSAKLPLVQLRSIISKLTLVAVPRPPVLSQISTTPHATRSCLIACIVCLSKFGSHSFSNRCNSMCTFSAFKSASRACFMASSALSFACLEQSTACRTACKYMLADSNRAMRMVEQQDAPLRSPGHADNLVILSSSKSRGRGCCGLLLPSHTEPGAEAA